MDSSTTRLGIDEQLANCIPIIRFALFILTIFMALFLFIALARFAGYTDIPGLLSSINDSSRGSIWPVGANDIFDSHNQQQQQKASSQHQNGNSVRFKASDYLDDGKHHLLLACTGSVATIKLPQIVSSFVSVPNISIRILISDSASKFLQSQSSEQPALSQISALPNVDGLYFDSYEWEKPWIRGDSIAHIEFRRWADLMVIAPLSANSLAKIVNGMADNLITSVVRAWDTTGLIDVSRPGIRLPYKGGADDGQGGRKGIIVAPAMNTAMWEHPVTKKHIDTLQREWGVDNGGWFEVLRPIEKELACGDSGSGAMRSWEEIVSTVKERLQVKDSRNEKA